MSNLKTVGVRIRTDDDLIQRNFSMSNGGMFCCIFGRSPASQNFDEMHDDVILENRLIIGVRQFKIFPRTGMAAETPIATHLNRPQCGVAFHNITRAC